jgi:hypothetical protein
LTPPIRQRILLGVTEAAEPQLQADRGAPLGTPASQTSLLGVVDPMRIPLPAPVARWWARLPTVGRAFVALAVLDVLARMFGVLQPGLTLDVLQPTFLIAQLLPRALLILLPALVLSRRSDAAHATPLVLGGAITIALVELLEMTVTGSIGGFGTDAMASWTLVSLVVVGLKAGAWITIAAGLIALKPPLPSRNVAGLGNLVAGSLAALAFVQLLLFFARPQGDLGDPGWNALYQLSGTFFIVQSIAWAFLARTVIRGAEDPRRPVVATRLAATAFVGLGAIALLELGLGLAVLFQTAFSLDVIPAGALDAVARTPVILLAWLTWFLTSAFLISFGLGLADASPPSDALAERQLHDEGPSWPTPA